MAGMQTQNEENYAPKMDKTLSQAINSWWAGLSKHDLLQYLDEQPTITADQIREMLAHESCVLSFGVQYDLAGAKAITAFTKEDK